MSSKATFEALLSGRPSVIRGPFSRLLASGNAAQVLATCHSEPEAGAEIIAGVVEAISAEIAALEGTEGVIYLLEGIDPQHATPMEYGGLFLEWDRVLLELANSLLPTVLCVCAGEEAYLDFAADLPAGLFAWNDVVTGTRLGAMRSMRGGLLACTDPEADLVWTGSQINEVCHA